MLVDVLPPSPIRFTPFLAVAPAFTAAFAGVRATAAVGVLAVGLQVFIDLEERPAHLNETVATAATITVTALVVLFAWLREQYSRRFDRAQSHALVAQRAVLRPLPDRVGRMEIASDYLAAESEAVMGGDLYAVARHRESTRLIIGDVRGKGLGAVGEAARVMGAFHAAANRAPSLAALASTLDGALCTVPEGTGDRRDGEEFVTALLIDVPDGPGPIGVVSCGHPGPVIVREGQPLLPPLPDPAPPLGLGCAPAHVRTGAFQPAPGDIVLLCTDGLLEARDGTGRFYPLVDRLRSWPGGGPRYLLSYLSADLLRHTGGSALNDDAALVALRPVPLPAARDLSHRRAHQVRREVHAETG
ncbi:PP2C family protein-serine/threonine phosphatase [Streptomyces sp. NPDC001046]|uniref:PP2C family protein-serine/threonine phosphatase n=1 Tax=Streptomyces sp. NPDC001046 TaxID=3364543 RepID=UPI0036B9240E